MPKGLSKKALAVREEIVALLKAGKTKNEVVQIIGCSVDHVCKVARNYNVYAPKYPRVEQTLKVLQQLINTDLTLTDIGLVNKVSPHYVITVKKAAIKLGFDIPKDKYPVGRPRKNKEVGG